MAHCQYFSRYRPPKPKKKIHPDTARNRVSCLQTIIKSLIVKLFWGFEAAEVATDSANDIRLFLSTNKSIAITTMKNIVVIFLEVFFCSIPSLVFAPTIFSLTTRKYVIKVFLNPRGPNANIGAQVGLHRTTPM